MADRYSPVAVARKREVNWPEADGLAGGSEFAGRDAPQTAWRKMRQPRSRGETPRKTAWRKMRQPRWRPERLAQAAGGHPATGVFLGLAGFELPISGCSVPAAIFLREARAAHPCSAASSHFHGADRPETRSHLSRGSPLGPKNYPKESFFWGRINGSL